MVIKLSEQKMHGETIEVKKTYFYIYVISALGKMFCRLNLSLKTVKCCLLLLLAAAF